MRRVLALGALLLAACKAEPKSPPPKPAAAVATTAPVPTSPNWLDTTRAIDSTAKIDTTWTVDTTVTIARIPGAVPPGPTPAFTATCSTRLVCRFDGSSSTVPAGAKAYSWYFGDGTAAGALIVPSKTYKVAGTYVVRFQIIDSLRRSATDTSKVTVGLAPPPPPPAPDSLSVSVQPAASTALHRPWMVYSYTDFYFGNHKPIDTAALRLVASRADRLTNGDTALWRRDNPHIEQVQYQLYHYALFACAKADPARCTTSIDTNSTGGIGPLDAFLAAHGYPVESVFLHRAGSAPSRASRIAWVAADSDSAVALNPADAGFRDYQTTRLAALVAHGFAGVFYDVFGRGAMGKMFTSAEGDSLWYRAALTDALRAERRATGGLITINTASYDTPYDSLCIVAAGGAHLEKTNYPLGQNLASQLNYWRWIDHLVAAGAKRLEFVSNIAWTDKVPAAVGNDVTPIGREKMAEYASYLMVKDTGTVVSFAPDNYWNQSPATHWLPAWDTALGGPLGARQLDASGVDPVGQKYQVWFRQYGRAIVLMRVATAGVPTNYGDSTAVSVPVGVSERLLRSDGSFAPRDSVVRLRAGEGVVLFTQ